MKKSVSLILSLLFAISSFVLPISASADDVDTLKQYTDSYVTYGDSSCTITMNAYVENTVKFDTQSIIPSCDVVLLFDQSKNMNSDRTDVIEAANNLVQNLPEATDGKGGHKISILGYGRLNNPAIDDSFDTSTYAGTIRKGVCHNTGIYSYDEETGAVSFHSGASSLYGTSQTRFKSEPGVADTDYFTFSNDGTADTVDSDGNITTAGNMPTLTWGSTDVANPGYSDCFMSQEAAENVLTEANMNMFNAGGSRMDAGIVLLNQVLTMRNSATTTYTDESGTEQTQNCSDRPLFVLLISGTSPTQHGSSGNTYTSRSGSVLKGAQLVKETGALFYALGDFEGTLASDNIWENGTAYNSLMQQMAASQSYYVSIANTTAVERSQRLQQLVNLINSGVTNSANQVITSTVTTTVSQNLDYDITALEKLYEFDYDNAAFYTQAFKGYEASTAAFYDLKQNTKTVSVTKSTDDNGVTTIEYKVSSIVTVPSEDYYANTLYPYGERVTVQITGTRKTDNSVVVITTLNDKTYDLGTITVSASKDGSDPITLSEEGTGIFKSETTLASGTYYIFKDGKIVNDADGNPITVTSGDVKAVKYYTVDFYNKDGSVYNNEAYDYDESHGNYVITGTVVANPESSTTWYNSKYYHNTATKNDFSTAITTKTELYADVSFTFNYYHTFKYAQPFTIGEYATLIYNGTAVDPANMDGFTIYKMNYTSSSTPTVDDVKNSALTTKYNEKSEDILNNNAGGKKRVGVSYTLDNISSMKSKIWFVFEFKYDGVTYTTSVKDRNFYDMIKNYLVKTDMSTTYNANQQALINSMISLSDAYDNAGITYSGDYLKAVEAANSKSAIADATATTGTYTLTPTLSNRNCDPWGVKGTCSIADSSGNDVAYSTFSDYGMVVCKGTSTSVDELIKNEDAVVYSSADGNIYQDSTDANDFCAYYVGYLTTLELSNDVSYVFYVKDADGKYYFSDIKTTSFSTLADSDSSLNSDLKTAISTYAQEVDNYEKIKNQA